MSRAESPNRTGTDPYENVPDELKGRDQWLLWDSSAETPRRPHWKGDFQISWSDPQAWHSFEKAVQAARSRETWGIGYVTAADNGDYPAGAFGVIDIDGGVTDSGDLKEWVPSLDRFSKAATYIERSPSGTGIHIPIDGSKVPDWWSDSQIGDHEGVDVLTNKFCTFTGDTLPESGSAIAAIDPTPWLFDAYEELRGEPPRLNDAAGASDEFDGDEWLDESDVEEALSHIDPDVAHSEWVRLAYAVHDYDSGSRGRSLFESWSQRGSKYDAAAENQIESIWSDASAGAGVSVATLVHNAKEAGWSPPSSTRPDPSKRDAPRSVTLRPGELQAYAGLGEDGEISDLNDRQKAAYTWELIKASEECYVRVSRENGALWAYDSERGTWNADGERALAQAARKTLGAVNYGGNVLEELKNQAAADPTVEVSTDTFGLDPGTLAVKNGLLDLEKAARDDPNALRELRPDDYAQTRLPVDYNPDADGEWKPFVGEVVENEMIDAVQEYIGYCLHRDATFERALLLVGGGANGKSTFLETIGALLGDGNTTNISPYDFGDKPSKAELHGGLANIAADLSSGSITGRSLGEFKKLTGGDAVTAKRLYKDPFKFTYTGGMLFAANEVPDVPVSDDDTAFWRRWIIVQFDNYFPEGSDRRDPMLGDRLQEPENLSAVLNWAIEGWTRLMERGEFTNVPGSPDDTRRKWQTWGDSLDYFLSNVAEHDPDAPNITTGEAWDVYRRWCRENGEDPVGQNKFTNAARDSGADLGYVSSVRTDRHATPYRGYKNFGTVDGETDPIDVISGSDGSDDDDDDTEPRSIDDYDDGSAPTGKTADKSGSDTPDPKGEGTEDPAPAPDSSGVGYPSLLADVQATYTDGDTLTPDAVAERIDKSERYAELGLAWLCDDFDGDVLTRESEGVYQYHE